MPRSDFRGEQRLGSAEESFRLDDSSLDLTPVHDDTAAASTAGLG